MVRHLVLAALLVLQVSLVFARRGGKISQRGHFGGAFFRMANRAGNDELEHQVQDQHAVEALQELGESSTQADGRRGGQSYVFNTGSFSFSASNRAGNDEEDDVSLAEIHEVANHNPARLSETDSVSLDAGSSSLESSVQTAKQNKIRMGEDSSTGGRRRRRRHTTRSSP